MILLVLLCILYTVKKFGRKKKSILWSPRLYLFDQKHSKYSNIMKQYLTLK